MAKLFPSQLENEKIYLVVREHPFHLFLKLFAWSLLLIVFVLFQTQGPELVPALFEGRIGNIVSIFSKLYLLVSLLSLFIVFVIYYLNVQIITNLRIVDVTQVGLFSHTVSELHIDKIEDVTSQIKGVFGTIFNYGDVYVQTAAAVDRFEFPHVPSPGSIEKLILDLYEKNSNFVKNEKLKNL